MADPDRIPLEGAVVHYANNQGMDGHQRTLPHWLEHHLNCYCPDMDYFVPRPLHEKVLDLLSEYDASRPRHQFAAQARDLLELNTNFWTRSSTCDIVFSRWAKQGLANYVHADHWGHETVQDADPQAHISGPSELYLVDADMGFHACSDRSRPLHQFTAQVAWESRSLVNQFRYGSLVRDYDNGDGGPNALRNGSGRADDSIAVEVGIPDLATLAYKRVQRKWMRWRIWDKHWGVLPGFAWKHEKYLDDFMREHLGGEQFARLPPNYLQGMGRFRDPVLLEQQRQAVRRGIIVPRDEITGAALEDYMPGAAVVPAAAVSAVPGGSYYRPYSDVARLGYREPTYGYPAPESDGGRSNIENEAPVVAGGEPTVKTEASDDETQGPIVKVEAPSVEQSESGNTHAEPVIKREEPDSEMDQVRIKEEEGSIKAEPALPGVSAQFRYLPVVNPSHRLDASPMQANPNGRLGSGTSGQQTIRPRSNLNAILNNDASTCPFTNPGYDPVRVQINGTYVNSTRDTARGGRGSGPSAMLPAPVADGRSSPRGLPPSRQGNPYRVEKPGSSPARGLWSAAAERAALAAIPRSQAATAAEAAAGQAWMDQRQTYSSSMQDVAGGWLVPVHHHTATTAADQTWPGPSHTAVKKEEPTGDWMGPAQNLSAIPAWTGHPVPAAKQEEQASDSAAPYPVAHQYPVPAPAAQGDGQASGSGRGRTRASMRSRKGKGKDAEQ